MLTGISQAALLAIVGAFALYQGYVSWLVSKADYTSTQKWAQFAGIWLLPLLGAIGCHAM